jgi:hypothetical protein
VKPTKKAPLTELKDDLSKFLRLAEKEEIVIARHLRRLCRAAGVLVGFASEGDWFGYQLENDPRLLERIASARASLREGRGVKLEDIDPKLDDRP